MPSNEQRETVFQDLQCLNEDKGQMLAHLLVEMFPREIRNLCITRLAFHENLAYSEAVARFEKKTCEPDILSVCCSVLQSTKLAPFAVKATLSLRAQGENSALFPVKMSGSGSAPFQVHCTAAMTGSQTNPRRPMSVNLHFLRYLWSPERRSCGTVLALVQRSAAANDLHAVRPVAHNSRVQCLL